MSQLFGVSSDSSLDDLVIMLSSQEVSASDRPNQVVKHITVPTSEHVAQIVGKSGSKIKNLRAATQTCIRTPLRGDDPVFTVSGNESNVDKVINVIKQASDHFTKLMESRSHACAVGEVTIQVPVPQQYVGVVVGRNGSIIMRIKEQTRTRINTPKGDTQTPAFEVTGTQMNVMAAKEAIEDKVRQALMLKDSTEYDPQLSHKTKSLNEAIEWPLQPPQQYRKRCPPEVMTPTTSRQISNLSGNQSQPPPVPRNCWPLSESVFQSGAPSPHLLRFSNFVDNSFAGPLSPLESDFTSFPF